jgi:hypothetical protein
MPRHQAHPGRKIADGDHGEEMLTNGRDGIFGRHCLASRPS